MELGSVDFLFTICEFLANISEALLCPARWNTGGALCFRLVIYYKSVS